MRKRPNSLTRRRVTVTLAASVMSTALLGSVGSPATALSATPGTSSAESCASEARDVLVASDVSPQQSYEFGCIGGAPP
jgi:hypothetical protein